MKKILSVSAAALILGFTTASYAAFIGPGSSNIATVSQVKEMRDESKVIMQGHIESHLGGEYYLFKDQSGSIKVEIDDDVWKGVNVTPQDKVEISGEIDTHIYKPTDIEVETIKIIK